MAEKKKLKQGNVKRLYKSRSDKWIDGVCAGVADYFNIDVTLVRVLWVLSIFLNGLGVITYITAMIVMPAGNDEVETSETIPPKRNPILFLGAGLILLGMIIMFQRLDFPFRWYYPTCYSFHKWWMFRGDILLPLLLILGGIIYLVWILNRNKDASETKSKPQKIEHKKFYRTTDEKMIGGVCGGIAQYLKIDVSFIRIGFVAFALLVSLWVALVAYVVLLVVMSQSDDKKTESE